MSDYVAFNCLLSKNPLYESVMNLEDETYEIGGTIQMGSEIPHELIARDFIKNCNSSIRLNFSSLTTPFEEQFQQCALKMGSILKFAIVIQRTSQISKCIS